MTATKTARCWSPPATTKPTATASASAKDTGRRSKPTAPTAIATASPSALAFTAGSNRAPLKLL